jgi:PAS domain S-box-containing protein
VQDEASKPLPSIRSQIALLVLACALPALAALLLFIFHVSVAPPVVDDQRLARAVAVSLDSQLRAIESAAVALSAAPGLKSGDYAGFHSQASALLRPGFPGLQILLSDASGQVLATTSHGLPRAANALRLKPLFTHGRATLTRSTTPVATGAAAPIALDVPIHRDGKPFLAVTVLLPAQLLDTLLAAQATPPGLAATLLNAQDHLIARSTDSARTAGEPTIQSSYLSSIDAPWSITITLPSPGPAPGEQRFLIVLATAITMILLAGFVLAWAVGGRISRSIRALTAPARALAAGAPLQIEPMGFREADEVAKALQHLGQDLNRHRQALENQVHERTRQLEDNNALLETICASAPVGLSFVDTRLQILMINDYLAALNGMPASAHLGKRFDELILDHALLASVNDAYHRVLSTGESVTGIEFGGRAVARPDRDSSFVASYHPVFGADGRLVGITGLLVDMTEQKAIEAQLRESKQLFKSVLENLPAVVFVKEAQTLRYELLNRQGEHFFGRPREEVLGKNDANLFPFDQAESFEQADRHVLSTGEELVLTDEEIRSADGEQHWVTTRKVALRGDDGKPAHLLGISLDITERKRADAALLSASQRIERSNAFLQTVTDNLPGVVAYWDADLHCRFANKFFFDWFRKTQEETIGAHMSTLLPDFFIEQIRPQLKAVLGGTPQNFANELQQPDGELRYGWTNLIPDIDEQGEVRGFYALASDVTELKRSELRLQELNEQLVRARDRAEAASSAKSEFVANMSHEIRTPMNAIIGLARLLEEAPLERRERSYVGKIQMATKSLLGVVNDVLDFSKIEAGQLRLEQTRFNLEHMLANTAMLVAGSAWDKGVEPVFDIAPGLPVDLIGDSMRLHQVLLNLLSNAVKFTEHGEVVLGVREVNRDGPRITLEFYVHDTGIGIPGDQQLRMFDAFSQGDSSTSRKYGGTGLGLAICRRLVDLMGGVISVQSTAGEGSTFRFVCPLLCAPGQTPDDVPSALRGLHVLVVDDNRSVLHALEHAGDAMGWAVWLCASATEGLHTLRSLHARGQKLDLLVIDSAMPESDGISMLVEARGTGGMVLPRVVMMASEQSAEDLRQLADSLQIDAVLAKPCTPTHLRLAALEALTGAAATPERAAPTPLAGRLSGLRVLLVEDNEINQEMARYILLHADAQVEIAANGAIAVDMLREAPDRAHAVLMDLQMPVMNGYEATSAIRAMGLTGLPVIAMTANAMEEDRLRAIAAGVDAHIAKPIDVDELITTLTRFATPVKPAASSSPVSSPAPAGDDRPQALEGIDLNAALARMGGNYPAFVSLLKRFERSQGASVAEINQLLRQEKRHGADQVLHRVKGVAANLGAREIADLCAEAQAALADDEDSALQTLLRALEDAIARLTATARALPEPAPTQAPGAAAAGEAGAAGAPAGSSTVDAGALADLLSLLRNSNMRAIAAFKSLRGAIEGEYPDLAPALNEAIDTLDFTAAEHLVKEMLKRREWA